MYIIGILGIVDAVHAETRGYLFEESGQQQQNAAKSQHEKRKVPRPRDMREMTQLLYILSDLIRLLFAIRFRCTATKTYQVYFP